ncbi:phospho-N-acetylmuramoyl-pentapeptide-transferase [candidate division KSB1 bacterium]|nr:phospho-N-acetylmuramoyl-pentapeptide-transferase [candidate division KSB1 bacterium]RQW03696.1 MAG: phospho-N-acetylmuramoyl-pentapeptide-transferase [candidate division KSB1 bacterium]
MLYYLLEPYSDVWIGFNVVRYITFRSAAAAVMALLFSLFIGPIIIRWLQKNQIGEQIRADGPESHFSKRGTPSMGGIIILCGVLLPTLLLAQIRQQNILLLLLVTVGLGVLGFLDDWLKIVKKYPKGLVGRYKLLGQIVLGLAVGCTLYFFPRDESIRSLTMIPFLKDYHLNLGLFYIPVVVFLITGVSNSSNLTDGLDGLLTGLTAIAASAFAVIAYVTGHMNFSDYLNILYLDTAGEVAIFCSALFGATLGYLWYNTFPAQVFMGDTGSLALGGAIATVAILLKKEIWLLLICGVWVIETLSVIIQVLVFKRTGKRVFRMAPIHHHFELKGWAEPRVVVRFWIIGILFALIALATFKVR